MGDGAAREWLRQNLASLPAGRSRGGGFSTERFVREQAAKDTPSSRREIRVLDRLCKKVDVVRRLAAGYSRRLSRPAGPEPARPDFAVGLCALFLREAEAQNDPKFLNTALKMLDGHLRSPSAAYPASLRQEANRLVAGWTWPARGEIPPWPADRGPRVAAETSAPRTIDLTVLVYGDFCQTARAYLAYLRAHGLRPRKVLHVIAPGARPEVRWLSRLLGRRITSRIADWYVTRAFRPPRMRRLCRQVQAQFAIGIDYFGPMNYAACARDYERIVAGSLNSSRVAEALVRQPGRAFLYTCGGRVSAELLDLPEVRLIHIHPGVLPHVRGSDGMYWSIAVRGRPGASCFYMDRGIDTGQIIRARDLDPIRLPANLAAAPVPDLDKALVYACDPHLRARLLIEVLSNAGTGADLALLPASAQTPGQGRTFFHMHQSLKAELLRSLQGRRL